MAKDPLGINERGFIAEEQSRRITSGLDKPAPQYDFENTLTINPATLEKMIGDVVSKQTGQSVLSVKFNLARDDRWENDYYLQNVSVKLGAKL